MRTSAGAWLTLPGRGSGKAGGPSIAMSCPLEQAPFLGLEDAADRVQACSVLAIPALLATSAYTAAACQATWPGLPKTHLRQLVAVQQRRRHLLEREDVRVHAVMDEAALRRSICPANVMT